MEVDQAIEMKMGSIGTTPSHSVYAFTLHSLYSKTTRERAYGALYREKSLHARLDE